MKIAIFVSKIGVYVGVTAFALSMPHVSFADESNYGAGFVPSPTLNQANYGQGFVGSPNVAQNTNPGNNLPQSNYGQGFVGSPTVAQGTIPGASISQANYGQGFVGSPTLVGYNTYTFTTTGNYGAGYHTYGAPSSWSGYLGSYAWWW